MKIKELDLLDFKSYQQLQLGPCEHVNIIVGNNAQGKTNLLESIFYLSALRSFRSLKDRELIRFGKQAAKISADIQTARDEYRMEAILWLQKRRQIRLNGVNLRKTADMLGHLNCVLFSPDDLMLIKGSSAVRRRFMNLSLSQLRPRYFELLCEYNRLAVRKSRMLKDYHTKPALYEPLLAYNERMAEVGGAIIAYRAWFVNLLDYNASIIHSDIAPAERLALKYASCIEIEPEIDETEAGKRLMACLERGISNELRAKVCLYGPHRDEIEVELDQNVARLYASQGQARTASLALRLSERNIFYEDTGERPVLLLDDLLSELDASRQEYILKNLGEGQVFITCCDLNPGAARLAGRIFRISGGEASQI
jgi:DNA replication and repair protein RecF